MIKNTLLILILCSLLFSCGKKADPEYKVKKNNTLINKI
jgi:hypothetical protein